MLVGNLLSSLAMTFLTMPYYVNPLLKKWLRPPANVPAARTNLRGIAIVTAIMVFWAVVFWLLTTQIWASSRRSRPPSGACAVPFGTGGSVVNSVGARVFAVGSGRARAYLRTSAPAGP